MENSDIKSASSRFFGGRSKKWFILSFISILLVFLIPFITVICGIFIVPSVYGDTFLGELGEKYDRLTSIDEPKIVVIGGSSVAFGIDSALMEEHLDMPTVNFGLYADLGTKLMLDLSRSAIGRGDIIVLAPEINKQTLSLYFNGKSTWQGVDGRYDILSHVSSDDKEAMIGTSLSFAQDKLTYALSGTSPENSGAYKKENFNEYGDNVFDRPYNVMKGVQNRIEFDFLYNEDEVISEYEEFIDYVNEYIAYAEKQGAKVFYSFCPMSATALGEDVTEENIDEYYLNLIDSIKCPVISNIYSSIMDEGYFFDTEFHLNNAGVTVHTVRLIDDIKRTIGDSSPTVDYEKLPSPPGFAPDDNISDGDTGAEHFLYEEVKAGSTTAYKIIGVSDSALELDTLTIPNTYEGKPVTSIAAMAFASCTRLKTLYLGENINYIEGKAFANAAALTSVYIPKGTEAADISVPNSMSQTLATDGANPALRIYVEAEEFESFCADYNWGDYSGILEKWDD